MFKASQDTDNPVPGIIYWSIVPFSGLGLISFLAWIFLACEGVMPQVWIYLVWQVFLPFSRLVPYFCPSGISSSLPYGFRQFFNLALQFLFPGFKVTFQLLHLFLHTSCGFQFQMSWSCKGFFNNLCCAAFLFFLIAFTRSVELLILTAMDLFFMNSMN